MSAKQELYALKKTYSLNCIRQNFWDGDERPGKLSISWVKQFQQCNTILTIKDIKIFNNLRSINQHFKNYFQLYNIVSRKY